MDEDIDVSGNDFGTHRRRYAVASFLSVSSYTRFTFTMLVLSIVAPPFVAGNGSSVPQFQLACQVQSDNLAVGEGVKCGGRCDMGRFGPKSFEQVRHAAPGAQCSHNHADASLDVRVMQGQKCNDARPQWDIAGYKNWQERVVKEEKKVVDGAMQILSARGKPIPAPAAAQETTLLQRPGASQNDSAGSNSGAITARARLESGQRAWARGGELRTPGPIDPSCMDQLSAAITLGEYHPMEGSLPAFRKPAKTLLTPSRTPGGSWSPNARVHHSLSPSGSLLPNAPALPQVVAATIDAKVSAQARALLRNSSEQSAQAAETKVPSNDGVSYHNAGETATMRASPMRDDLRAPRSQARGRANTHTRVSGDGRNRLRTSSTDRSVLLLQQVRVCMRACVLPHSLTLSLVRARALSLSKNAADRGRASTAPTNREAAPACSFDAGGSFKCRLLAF